METSGILRAIFTLVFVLFFIGYMWKEIRKNFFKK